MSDGYYLLSLSQDNQHYFVLKAANNEIILTSERYTTKTSALNGIAAVRTNCKFDEQYERKKSEDNKDYFVLKAKNNEIIGHSETYNSAPGMETGIASVKKHGISMTITELEPA